MGGLGGAGRAEGDIPAANRAKSRLWEGWEGAGRAEKGLGGRRRGWEGKGQNRLYGRAGRGLGGRRRSWEGGAGIIIIIWLYITLNRTLNINCYWVGAVPNLNPKPQALDSGMGV